MTAVPEAIFPPTSKEKPKPMSAINKQTTISLALVISGLAGVAWLNSTLISAAWEIEHSLGERLGAVEAEDAASKVHFRAIESQFSTMGKDIAAIKDLLTQNASEVPELKAQLHYHEVRIEALETK